MIVKEKGRENSVEVYVLYWSNDKRYHMVIPYDGYNGLITLDQDEVEIIDPSVDGFVVRKDDYDGEILVHKLANDDGLIYKLIDHDPDAIREFERRRSEYK
jgi:hypothetical protein